MTDEKQDKDWIGEERRYVERYPNGTSKTLRAVRHGLWALAISVAGLIFATGTFYGQTLATESEFRATLAQHTIDQRALGDGISALSATMASVVSEQTAIRRDVERLKDGRK